MLYTVDPIGQGELEFHNCCYSSTAICLGALIIYLIYTMDPIAIGQNLQVTK